MSRIEGMSKIEGMEKKERSKEKPRKRYVKEAEDIQPQIGSKEDSQFGKTEEKSVKGKGKRVG
jgi:hypothetical protein